MTGSRQLWQRVLAAVLTLAIVLAFAPLDHRAASAAAQGAQSVAVSSAPAHHAPARFAQKGYADQPAAPLGFLQADCDGAAGFCCWMTTCHPGILSDPQPVPIGGMDDQTTAAAGLGGMGRDPEMILPPPRREPA